MLLEKDIELVNNIIEQATKDGGDAGGSYNNAEEDIYQAIYDYLKFYDDLDEYEIGDGDDWAAYKIVKK